jgi:phosphotransferase system IIB component
MARPQKQGLDYFALDVNMGDEAELIEAEHGMAGFAVLIKMFQKIYREGYFYEWNEKNQLLFSSRTCIDKNKIINIIDDCIKWEIFDGNLYDKYKILTSKRIQEQYVAAVYKRVNVEMVKDYILIDINDINDRSNITLIGISDDRNADTTDVSDVQSTQSKVNEIKLNEIKVYNTIFEVYNNQNIIVHRKLTDKIKNAIDKALRNDGEDIILEAIERYGQALGDEEYRFCTYKMTLDRFLVQDNGYMDWLDEGQKWINYMDFKNKSKEKPGENQNSKIKTKFHLAKSRGDKYTADELEKLVFGNQILRRNNFRSGDL